MLIDNKSNISFQYVMPDGSTISAELNSNIVTTEVLTYSVPKVKSSDKTFVQEGETVTQTVVITNNSQTTLFSQSLRDSMTNGAAYVAGSVIVNGVSQPSYDLNAGFPLPDLAPGQFVTVNYSVTANNPVTSTPVQNYAALTYTVNDPARGAVTLTENTNTVEFAVVSNRVSITKSVDKAFAVRGDTLRYTTQISNTGTLDKINLFFTDPIPAGTTFVAGSVIIDNVSYPAYNPAAGFPLPNLSPGQSVTVVFEVTVN